MGLFDFTGERTIFAGDNTIRLYSIGKKDLLNMNFEGVDKFFQSLDRLGKKAFNSAVIVFDGYNDSPKEMYEIPEARKYTEELFNRYPHLLNYINRGLEGHVVLLTCLLDLETFYEGERMSIEEFHQKNGIFAMPPRHLVHLRMPHDLLSKLSSAMLEHGKKLKSLSKAEKNVLFLRRQFNQK